MTEPVPGPSGPGTVVLELGPGMGALILRTAPEANGLEIEISPAGNPAAHRTHSQVRPRKMPGSTQYAAVYPGLPAGTYTIWLDAATPGIQVNVAEATATTIWWPASP